MTAHTYLVTIVATDVHPDEAMERHQRDSVDGVCGLLYPYLYRHGTKPLVNAQMAQEADPAIETLDHWQRDPREARLHLCGYLTRYDVDRVPLYSGSTWESERVAEARACRESYATAQLAKHVPSFKASDPLYRRAHAWVGADYTDSFCRMYGSRRSAMLAACWTLATELDETGLLSNAYTRASWALVTARLAVERRETFDQVAAGLHAEVAAARPSS